MKVAYIERPTPTPAPQSSPYSLIQLWINGKPMQGRPIAWNSVMTDHFNQLNADGGPVVPTRVITMCPDCSAGFELDIPPLEVDCPWCRKPAPLPPPLEDPYINPFESGVLDFEEVNVDLISVLNELPDTTVGDRLEQ